MVVLFHQYTENTRFFSNLSADGLCDWGILLVISLEFQGNKASTAFYDTANKNFIQLFPLEESMVKALCRLFLWSFKEKHGPVMVCGCFISTVR
ncbi:hypothetical protein [uncultured Bilophila sp.]|uniref:hypothetical protein n=1 Tax=uncultured Bilophila sp. TaxID=529385 RepID=UPI00280C1A69|nr:hypothetical protein [uncultured Bilophila sp.]